METHVKVLAVLNLAWGGLGVLTAFGLLLFFGTLAGFVGIAEPDAQDAAQAVPILALLGGFLFFTMAVLSLPSLLVGIGLLKWRTWGRILGIVISLLNLLNFPLGTALGVYGLWVLLQPESEGLFNGEGPVHQPARV
ncbi:MAG TPA: hypothetical protein VLV83_08065 [Acidobacteriota bacterium]|nr:hypothetical protein [Acidobacteriota bacterium]